MGRKTLYVILIVLLFVPSFIAVGYYSSSKKEPVNAKAVSRLKIEDPHGSVWEFSSDDEKESSKNIIDLFVAMKKNAESVAALPSSLESSDFFRVTLNSYETESVYKYYFTSDPNEAYIEDLSGYIFKVKSDDAAAFLSTEYAVSVYNADNIPDLVISGINVAPAEAIWYYTIYDGSYMKLDTTQLITNTVPTCSVRGGLSITFTDEPDYLWLTITDGDTEVYNNIYDDENTPSLNGAGKYNVTTQATWYAEDTDYNCSATYKFIAEIVEPASFYIGQTSVENGKFVVISGKNVADPSQIKFESNPSINYTPTFFAEGDYVYALVPISYELAEDKDITYEFTITYEGVSQTINLIVTPYVYKTSTLNISSAIEKATYTEELRAEAEALFREIAYTNAATERMFDGTFLEDVVGKGSTDKLGPGFGRMITVTSSGTKFRHTGCDYNVPVDTPVCAVNKGVVIFSDYNEVAGWLVVVDHGWGLKSWYAHLSKNTVKVGDVVEKCDEVGLSGGTGFTYRNRIHVGLSVFDVPVCIYPYWDDPVKIPEVGN